MDRQRACPRCGAPTSPDAGKRERGTSSESGDREQAPTNPAFPFCSPACKLADLAKWLDGSYRIATDDSSSADDLSSSEGSSSNGNARNGSRFRPD